MAGQRAQWAFTEGIASPSRTRFGGRVNTSPVPWVAAAQSDDVVADVLTYLRGEPDWFDLWKVFETMRDDINRRLGGQKRMVENEKGWLLHISDFKKDFADVPDGNEFSVIDKECPGDAPAG